MRELAVASGAIGVDNSTAVAAPTASVAVATFAKVMGPRRRLDLSACPFHEGDGVTLLRGRARQAGEATVRPNGLCACQPGERCSPDKVPGMSDSTRAGPAGRERKRDLERFLTFVDAVVAIAITLLVLPLVELSQELRSGMTVRDLLQDHSGELWAFFLSFAVVARMWFIQHQSSRHVVGYNVAYASLTTLWLLSIVLLPFATSLVPAAPVDDALTKALYMGTLALGVLFLGMAELVIVRKPELTDGLGRPDPMEAWINVGLLLVALAVSVLIPTIGYFALLLLLLDRPVYWVIKGRDGPPAEGAERS